MRVVRATEIEPIKPIALQWKAECNGETMGIHLEPDVYFSKLAELITRDDADLLLLLTNAGKVVGYMGVEIFFSPLGNQKIANEHNWYILEDHRGSGAMRMVRAIKEWAKEQGCSHLIMTASTLASDLHDKVCGFYESIGMKKFETSYIQEIL